MLSDDYTIKELGSINIAPILKEFDYIKEEDWDANTQRQNIPKSAQAETKFIPIIYKRESSYVTVKHLFPNTLKIIESTLKEKLGEIQIGRAIFTCLPAGKIILPHKDSGAFLETNTRIHIPLISNNKVSFGVYENNQWNFMYLEPGKFYALNNCNTRHRVNNNSDLDRYHLIIDVKDIKKVPLI